MLRYIVFTCNNAIIKEDGSRKFCPSTWDYLCDRYKVITVNVNPGILGEVGCMLPINLRSVGEAITWCNCPRSDMLLVGAGSYDTLEEMVRDLRL